MEKNIFQIYNNYSLAIKYAYTISLMLLLVSRRIVYDCIMDRYFRQQTKPSESETYRVLNGIKKSDLKECQGCEISNFCTRCPGNALIEDGNLLGCSTLDKRFAVLSAEKNNKSVHNE